MLIERSTRRRWMAGLLMSAATLGLTGCDDHYPETRRKVIKLEELPENIASSAKKALPNITLEDTWQNLSKDGKVESYEVRGKDAKGKIREVRVGLDGSILELE